MGQSDSLNTEERYLMRITPGELFATQAKINKINARAEKRGFTGRIEVKSEQVTVTRTNPLGLEIKEVMYDVTISGEAPKYNGWQLAAVLDWDAEAGLIVRTAPGVTKIDRDSLQEGWCDHCRTRRHRNETYLVRHDDSTEKQVGSTCIKDFLGWEGKIVFLSSDEVSEDLEDYLSGGKFAERRWETITALAASWAAIQTYGYIKADDWSKTSTKETVRRILDPSNIWERKEAEEIRPYIDQSYRQAGIIRDWILSDDFAGDNEYVRNLKAVASAETVSLRQIGLLASAPLSWARAQERALREKQEREELRNEFFGKIGERIELSVTVKSLRYIDTMYGTSTLYVLVSDTGHVFKWFSSNGALGSESGDKVFRIKGTIKNHDEYQGKKSTILTRVKVL
jgi:hypothetical protein